MIEQFRGMSELFDRNYAGFSEERATVTEKRQGGECIAYFDGVGPHVYMTPFKDRHPIAWIREKKCADGAFITANENGEIHVRLVELKSRINIDDWEAIRRQYAGMLHNVCALLGFVGLQRITRVTCYLVYSRDEVRVDRTASPILLKLGQAGLRTASADWTSYRVTLPRGIVATLVRKIRGDSREVTFEAV